jgi:hypothetical protein
VGVESQRFWDELRRGFEAEGRWRRRVKIQGRRAGFVELCVDLRLRPRRDEGL